MIKILIILKFILLHLILNIFSVQGVVQFINTALGKQSAIFGKIHLDV